jgi:ATP-dependent Zn protease
LPWRFRDFVVTRGSRSALEATAYHAAGRAVIGRVLGLTCGQVTIKPDSGSIGHVIIRDPWQTIQDWEDRQHFRDPASAFRGTIIARMAGREAELEIFGTQGDEGDYRDDEVQIALLLQDAEPWGDPDRFKTRLRGKTRRLVRRHRQSIERIADALLSRSVLTRDAVEAIMARQPDRPSHRAG